MRTVETANKKKTVMQTETAAPKSLWESAKQTIRGSWSTVRWFVLILAFVIAAALFAHWNAQRAQQFSAKELDGVRKLIHYASGSAEKAQQTRQNALQSLLHTNYAICYVNAAKHMVGGAETLQKIVENTNINAFHTHLQSMQAQLLNKIRQQAMQKSVETDLLRDKKLLDE